MRIAIFSDVHSNLEAFEAVIEAMKRENVDKYICGGDIVGYGADPHLCIELTKKLTTDVVCGNHDRASSGIFELSHFNDNAKKAVCWTALRLDEREKAYLKDLKIIHRDSGFILVHGSLDKPEKFHYIFDLHNAKMTFQLMQSKVCFVGHSHSPLAFASQAEGISCSRMDRFKLKEGAFYIINVGSVGQPRDGDPRACYVIYDTDTNCIETKRVSYDIKKCQDKILDAGLPAFLAERLSIGR